MGWTVLYIAFGIVALWLLGEVLLQYKARLRWRLLAFAGFLGVVVGVLIPSVVVIGLGAAAFAVGQTYVTLSFRRGFAAGWAVTGRPASGGGKRNRRDRQEPTLEVSDLRAGDHADATHGDDDGLYGDDDRDDVFTPARAAAPSAAETTAVYEPQPMPDDTGSYGVYGDPAYPGGDRPQDQYAATAQTADQGYGYDGYSGYGQGYGYDTTGGQQYAAYSDPYIGTQTYSSAGYDPAYDLQYGQEAHGQGQFAPGGYGGETPSGGVWVPQQRTTDDPFGGDLPPEQPYGHPGDDRTHGQGYDEQYRF
ncbi:hypothetical protein [Streptomyces glaucescens]|uniref:Uncharacterized protein n=1 Tax=Streptomyces glaucescens TaxID=1907 RepID=A0A089XA02_STRGA|nr:hypothetical protein [Streptomyces glaucescens]AIR97924.1 hypothetical protein SGLAU_09570 [Streptomyces glaucescens]